MSTQLKKLIVRPGLDNLVIQNPRQIRETDENGRTVYNEYQYTKGINELDKKKVLTINPKAQPTRIILRAGLNIIDDDTKAEFLEKHPSFGRIFMWHDPSAVSTSIVNEIEAKFEVMAKIQKASDFDIQLIAFNSGLFSHKDVVDGDITNLKSKLYLQVERDYKSLQEAVTNLNAKATAGEFFVARLFILKVIYYNPADSYIYQTSNKFRVCFVPIGQEVTEAFLNFQANKEHKTVIDGLLINLKDEMRKSKTPVEEENNQEEEQEKTGQDLSLEEQFPKVAFLGKAAIKKLLDNNLTIENIAKAPLEVFLETLLKIESSGESPIQILIPSINRGELHKTIVERAKELQLI